MRHSQIIDHNALKFNQLSIVTLTTLGFILNAPVLPAFVSLVLIGGSLTPRLALFKLFYRHAILRLGLMRSHIVEEASAPHEFAQLLGGLVLGSGVAFLFLGSEVTGWALAWIVIFLALANLLFGFCAGCFIYFQLGRLGLPGFTPNASHPTPVSKQEGE